MSKALFAPVFALVLSLATVACAAPGEVVPISEVRGGRYTLDPTHATVIFRINHLGFSEFYGRFDRLQGGLTWDPAAPEKAEVEIEIDPASVSTTVAALDTQLVGPQVFDAAAFPKIVFAATGITVLDATKGRLDGSLTIKGVSRPVSLDVTFVGAGLHPLAQKSVIGFNATAAIKRSEWGLTAWDTMVGDEVELLIAAEFQFDG